MKYVLINVSMNSCSSLGQALSTSTYVGEIIFAVIIAILGLVLFGLLIGNMQVSSILHVGFKNRIDSRLRKNSLFIIVGFKIYKIF